MDRRAARDLAAGVGTLLSAGGLGLGVYLFSEGDCPSYMGALPGVTCVHLGGSNYVYAAQFGAAVTGISIVLGAVAAYIADQLNNGGRGP
jgi:hypothetical protein